MIETIVYVLVALVGAFVYGRSQGKRKQIEEIKEREREVQRKVIEVKPASDAAAALDRLRKNGYVNSVPADTTERQLKLPL